MVFDRLLHLVREVDVEEVVFAIELGEDRESSRAVLEFPDGPVRTLEGVLAYGYDRPSPLQFINLSKKPRRSYVSISRSILYIMETLEAVKIRVSTNGALKVAIKNEASNANTRKK